MKNRYPENPWSTRVYEEKREIRRAERLEALEEGAWIVFLCAVPVAAAIIFGFKDFPYGPQAIIPWALEVSFFTVASLAVWRFERISAGKAR
jgi:hypothetical protein